jgi:hypothetical protein
MAAGEGCSMATINWLAASVRTLQARVTFLEKELTVKEKKENDKKNKKKDLLQMWYDSDSELEVVDVEDAGGEVHGEPNQHEDQGGNNNRLEIDEEVTTANDGDGWLDSRCGQTDDSQDHVVQDLDEDGEAGTCDRGTAEKDESTDSDRSVSESDETDWPEVLNNLEGDLKEQVTKIRTMMQEKAGYERPVSRQKGNVERLIRSGRTREEMASIIKDLTFWKEEAKRLNKEVEKEARDLTEKMKLRGRTRDHS